MKSRIWIAVAVLALAALACSLPGGGNPTPAQPAEATQAPSSAEEGATAVPPTSEPGGGESGGEVPQVDSDALTNLNSYRVRVVVAWTPEGGEAQSTTLVQEHTREPQAQRTTMEAPGFSSEYVQIGGTTWVCFAGSCTQTQAGEDPTSGFGEMLNLADWTGSDMNYVGQETVNGISTRHYTLNLSAAEVALSQGEVSNVAGDVWIADDPSLPTFVVRQTMSWDEARDGQAGASSFSYEVYDVNSSFTIEPPEGAAATGLPEDVPAYPGATELTTMEGLATFSTADDVATVADFYRTELAAQGWTITSDETLGDMVNQTWSKESRTLNLLISAGDQGGSSVMIALQ